MISTPPFCLVSDPPQERLASPSRLARETNMASRITRSSSRPPRPRGHFPRDPTPNPYTPMIRIVTMARIWSWMMVCHGAPPPTRSPLRSQLPKAPKLVRLPSANSKARAALLCPALALPSKHTCNHLLARILIWGQPLLQSVVLSMSQPVAAPASKSSANSTSLPQPSPSLKLTLR